MLVSVWLYLWRDSWYESSFHSQMFGCKDIEERDMYGESVGLKCCSQIISCLTGYTARWGEWKGGYSYIQAIWVCATL